MSLHEVATQEVAQAIDQPIEMVLKQRWERKKELDRQRIKSIPQAMRRMRSKKYYEAHKEEIRRKNKERYHLNKAFNKEREEMLERAIAETH